MRSIDTNIVVRVVTEDDSRQLASAVIFIENGAWVSILALTEAVWVLATRYALGPMAIATAVEMLLDHEKLVLQDADTVAAALQSFRVKPALGFSDRLMLHIARKAGHLPFGTFDLDLAKLEVAQRL